MDIKTLVLALALGNLSLCAALFFFEQQQSTSGAAAGQVRTATWSRAKLFQEAGKRTDGLSVFIVDMREVKGKGLEIRPIRTMMNHATTEVFFDNMRVPASSPMTVPVMVR